MTPITISSEPYPRDARERDLVDFLVANKNKAFSYEDIALGFQTTKHTAQEIVRKLKREGKVIVRYIKEERRIFNRSGYQLKPQKIAYITIDREWLRKHREEINESDASVPQRS